VLPSILTLGLILWTRPNMELKHLLTFITIADQLVTNVGLETSTLKMHQRGAPQVVSRKIVMRASRMFGVAATHVPQPLDGVILGRRTCTGAVQSHASRA